MTGGDERMATARRVWVLYAAATVAVVATLAILSGIVLTLERDTEHARARRAAIEQVQEALWRLDAFVVPVLGRQAAFAYSHYVPAFAPAGLFTPEGSGNERVLVEISPILTTRWPDWVLLHFQAPVAGGIASPEIPEGRHAWVRQERGLNPAELEAKRALLRRLGAWLDRDTRRRLAARSVGHQEMWARDLPAAPTTPSAAQARAPARVARRRAAPPSEEEEPRNEATRARRRRYFARGQAQLQTPEPVGTAMMNVYLPKPRPAPKKPKLPRPATKTKLVRVDVSDVAAAWIPGDGGPALILYRSASLQGRKFIQGSLLDWPRLRRALAAEVQELLPEVQLLPKPEAEKRRAAAAGDVIEDEMSILPVVLRAAGVPGSMAWHRITPVRTALLITWGVALLALLVTGVAVRGMGDLARRRMNFVSAVSHELRAPLTALRMYLDMLAEGMIDSEEKRAEILKTLQGQAERLSGLVRGVLDYARLERRTFQAHLRSVSVDALLADVERACRDRCAASGQELVVERGDGLGGGTIETDPEAVMQIVLNLIDNACKYAGEGQVRLRALEGRDETEALVLEVSDDGPGIPPEARRRLFQAFYRAGSEMTREHPGVGLGLAIAQGFADAIGARLELVGGPLPGGNLQATFALRLGTRSAR
jgi:signal transduction histidine kinase